MHTATAHLVDVTGMRLALAAQQTPGLIESEPSIVYVPLENLLASPSHSDHNSIFAKRATTLGGATEVTRVGGSRCTKDCGDTVQLRTNLYHNLTVRKKDFAERKL